MEKVDTLIIGAGIVGAGIAYALRGQSSTYVVEAAPRPGTGISSRNSGVIHAGIYYPQDSLKTRLCRRGASLLYRFAREHGVHHQQTGKYIVANGPEELVHLAHLAANSGEVVLHEVDTLPAGIQAQRALFSPRSGVVDTHQLIEALLAASALPVLYNQTVTALETWGTGVKVTIGDELYQARRVVNCSGLAAAGFAAGFRHYWARGSYFKVELPARLDVPALVYPAVPKSSSSLGIHLTRNLHGEAYLGPDLEWVERPDYAVDSERLDVFFQAASRYLPWLSQAGLSPGYAGVRPKLSRSGFRDFTFAREGSEGALIHCLGIESPGLTAAMAIGEFLAPIIMAKVG